MLQRLLQLVVINHCVDASNSILPCLRGVSFLPRNLSYQGLLCIPFAQALGVGCAQFLHILDRPVEVAGGGLQSALLFEDRKLRMGMFFGQSMRDFASTQENLPITQAEETVELVDPIAHVHGLVASRLSDREI